MIHSFDDVRELKKEVAEKFSVPVHFHDGCGGQYFTLEAPDPDLITFITRYCTERNRRAVFIGDGTRFTIE